MLMNVQYYHIDCFIKLNCMIIKLYRITNYVMNMYVDPRGKPLDKNAYLENNMLTSMVIR